MVKSVRLACKFEVESTNYTFRVSCIENYNLLSVLQVQNLEEEFEILKRNSAAALSAQNTLEVVSSRAEQAERELECAENERDRLTSELQKQQTLYSELKKMRGRGEELDALKDSQQARENILGHKTCSDSARLRQ